MKKTYISTEEIIKRGNELNKKHRAYKKAEPKDKPDRWKEFYEAWQKYRSEVNAYVKTYPLDISDSL